MKKMTERDKTLAMILPALVILLAYGLFVLRGKALELTRTHDALAKTMPPSPAEIGARRIQAAQLSEETQAIQAKLAAVQKKWGYETAFCAPGTHRLDRVEKLTSLLNRYRLTAMEDHAADDSARETKASPALETMIQKIAQLSSTQKPQLRRIRFFGRFADVHDALDELAKGPLLAIPVGLSMKTTTHDDLREWTLLVWV